MSQTNKAMWLSALVFPGSGHLLLKRYKTAGALIVASGAALYFLLGYSLSKAQAIADKIVSGEVGMEVDKITALLTAPAPPELAPYVSIATYVLVIAWIIGLADCYRVGKNQHHRHRADDAD